MNWYFELLNTNGEKVGKALYCTTRQEARERGAFWVGSMDDVAGFRIGKVGKTVTEP